MPRELEFFPESMFQLQRELVHHPELIPYLNKYAIDDVVMRMLEIATFTNLVLHGTYSREDMINLIPILTDRLKVKRGAPRDLLIVQEIPEAFKNEPGLTIH